MTSTSQLMTLAIKASQEGRWQDSQDLNGQILEQEPENIGAINRLAFCQMQLGDQTTAKKLYEKVLELDHTNGIATKYLGLLKHKVKFTPPAINTREDFIEEPGKSKSVSLQKLADPDVLQSVSIATECKLVARNHRVDVKTANGGIYLGSLPDDIAYRLQKLMKAGNEYRVFVQSTTKKNCNVFIKEVLHSNQAPFSLSFPSNSHSTPTMQEDVLLEETPLEISETGEEESETPDMPQDEDAIE